MTCQSSACACGRRCRYAANSEPPKDVDSQRAQNWTVNQFPAAYSLDHQVFRQCQITIQKPQFVPPLGGPEHLKSVTSIRHVADHFFGSVHLWFPILSRSKVYGNIMQQQLHRDADPEVLVASMQILLPKGAGIASSYRQTYALLKHHLVCLELSGAFNITVLQSTIFITLYELAHGIYPAAYLTVGACARYAVALGLGRDISEWDESDFGWAPMEEKHRAWWVIIILERHMNIDSPRRALCTPDPSEKDYLPLPDDDWNNGTRRGQLYTIAAPTNTNMGRFARLAQASYLLSRVIRHICDTQVD